MNADRIHKQVLLNTSLARAWSAVSDSRQFGSWFGMKLNGPFQAGKEITGTISPTTAAPDVAKSQKPYEGKPVAFLVDKIEPLRLFSFKWHPFAIEEGVDYSREPMTLVTFTFEEKNDGVLLNLTETGFDQIPVHRREQAWKANDGGWAPQMVLISKYLRSQS